MKKILIIIPSLVIYIFLLTIKISANEIYPPEITSAKTSDSNLNGRIDKITLTFNHNLNPETVDNTDFNVEGYQINSAVINSELGNIIDLFLNESESNDTGQTPKITIKDHAVNDFPGGNWNAEQSIIPADGAAPLKPTINISGGTYSNPQTITLSSSDFPNNPHILYTFDGSDPFSSPTKKFYSGPFSITENVTLKALAKDNNLNKSEILVQEYQIAIIPSPTNSPSPTPTSTQTNSSSSVLSATTSVCTDEKPKNAPKIISAFPGLNTVTLTWEEAENPVSYYLLSYGVEPAKPIYGNPNIGGHGTKSFVVENLSGGTRYYFKVRAGNGCAPGDFSNEISATPFGLSIQATPTPTPMPTASPTPKENRSGVLGVETNKTDQNNEKNKEVLSSSNQLKMMSISSNSFYLILTIILVGSSLFLIYRIRRKRSS